VHSKEGFFFFLKEVKKVNFYISCNHISSSIVFLFHLVYCVGFMLISQKIDRILRTFTNKQTNNNKAFNPK
jgi:hypothetical protein